MVGNGLDRLAGALHWPRHLRGAFDVARRLRSFAKARRLLLGGRHAVWHFRSSWRSLKNHAPSLGWARFNHVRAPVVWDYSAAAGSVAAS
jgi:hypothetical protein